MLSRFGGGENIGGFGFGGNVKRSSTEMEALTTDNLTNQEDIDDKEERTKH